MASTKFKERKTPGVYITEVDAFPSSIVGVQTAVPAFIGYTERATINGKSILWQPVKISSMADYEQFFGGGFEPTYKIVDKPDDSDEFDFEVAGNKYLLEPDSNSKFYLYYSMRLFFNNGGGDCYIVSVGGYTDQNNPDGVPVEASKLKEGLDAISDEVGPTMLVVPDATLIAASGILDQPTGTTMPYSEDYNGIMQSMLKQCSELQDRVAILDVYGTDQLTTQSEAYAADLGSLVEQFQAGVGDSGLSFGMGYFPFLKTNVVDANEIDYTNISNRDKLKEILELQANLMYADNNQKRNTVQGYISEVPNDPPNAAAADTLNQNLVNALPVMKQVNAAIAELIGVLPPSGGMAGIFNRNDQNFGVWNAPANQRLSSVLAPSVNLNDEEQGDLNVPLNGKAINVIRAFPSRGTLIWGARTLEGNSQDWRYVQVRRNIIYIEQSISNALDSYVFAPNDGNTWVRVVASASSFLEGLWKQGGVTGATATEAFSVECGRGSTMTAEDIRNGYMIVQVKLSLPRPAEFIELRFQQVMES